MGYLRAGVAAEVANAIGAHVGHGGQLFGAHGEALVGGYFAKVPILAKKTVGSTRGIEYRQVVLTLLLVAGTNPIGDAVSRQRVTVPMKQTALGRASQVDQATRTHGTQSTKAITTFPDLALVGA